VVQYKVFIYDEPLALCSFSSDCSTVSGFDLAWFSSLSSKCLCVFGLHGAVYV